MLWTQRVLQPGTDGVALSDAQRSKPAFDKVVLTTKQAKGEVHMHRSVLEDNIEQGTLQTSLIDFMGTKISGDLEDILINGDTLSADVWLAHMDGLLKLATSNVYPAGTVALAKAVLRDLIQTMPEEFGDQEGLKFFTNRKARSDYRSSLSDRATALGDTMVAGTAPMDFGYDGIPIEKVPRFPNNLGVGANTTNVLLMNPKNAIMGFQRRVTLETEFRISEQVWAIVVTLRMAIQFEHEPAVAKATQVLGQ
jgi:hypothetical protein